MKLDWMKGEEGLVNRFDQVSCNGISTSFGEGIYRTELGYMIKVDDSQELDYGPYNTIREVLLATIPDEYALAGPKYQSTIDVKRLTRREERAAAVAELEAIRVQSTKTPSM